MAPFSSSQPVDRLTLEDLGTLARSSPGPVVSIHMPTARAGREVRQGPIRLSNLVDAAEVELRGAGVEPDPVLAPLRDLLRDDDAWQHQADGLALYADGQGCRGWRVAVELAEAVRVSEHPHLRPLLPLANGDERFAVLAVSQHAVRLLDCTRDSVDRVELPAGTPTSMAEALAHEDPEKQLQVRAGSAGGSDQAGMFHGHGAERDEKEAMARYLRAVDTGVSEVLRATGLPLVVAAVERHGPTYREVTDHPDVLEAVVAGSPDEESDDRLRAAAWPLVAERAAERRRRAIAVMDDRRGDGGVIEGIAEVALAAALGRVDTIVVDRLSDTWGHLDADAGEVTTLKGPGDGAVELHDAAVAHGLRTGATVLTALPDELPAGSVASTRW